MKKSLGPKIVVGATVVWVVGTYDRGGRPNLMTAAWGGVCCGDPPCLGVSLRKATYSHGSIVEQKAFTINIPPAAYVKEADYVGIASGRDTDKWQTTGLTPLHGDVVNAPYVAEFPIALECRLLHTMELGLHTHFIGEIMDAKVDDSVLGDDSFLSIEKAEPFFFVPGGRDYYAMGRSIGKPFSVGTGFRANQKKRE
jgi:flavin reductase (DIM6/NTAB) family NADH-FMN oxidoreductase RutF